jgi:hypothetical protein
VTETELTLGLPFLGEQLREALLRATSDDVADHTELRESASRHAVDLFERGLGASIVARSRGLDFAVRPVEHSVAWRQTGRFSLRRSPTCSRTPSSSPAAVRRYRFARPRRRHAFSSKSKTSAAAFPRGKQKRCCNRSFSALAIARGWASALSVCVKAMKETGDELRLRDLPGNGCVFTIDLPKQLPAPISLPLHARKARAV